MSVSFDDLARATELEYNGGGVYKKPTEDSTCIPHPRRKRTESILTALSVVMWMGSNLGVLLLNKLLLSYWNFKQPVLLTFLHMISGMLFIWGLRACKLLAIQNIQSRQQLTKVMTLSLVFACAVLCANVSLKFLAVSMNQAIGAATPVFAAVFAFLLQGERESTQTYSTLALVVGGVIVASGVEPSLDIFGAAVCFFGAAFRGLRAVMQAILLKPEEKLDSMSCLAYMAPFSSALMLVLCLILEPSSLGLLVKLPFEDSALVSALLLNCLAAFASNYFNMVVTKRTSALTIQGFISRGVSAPRDQTAIVMKSCFSSVATSLGALVLFFPVSQPAIRCKQAASTHHDFQFCDNVLGQCKGVISAVVSVLCFHNIVPMLGWCGYSVTVGGCLLYARCKVHSRMQATKHLHKSSTYNLQYLSLSTPASASVSPRLDGRHSDKILTGEAGGRRTAPFFRTGVSEEAPATTQEELGSGNGHAPHGPMGLMPVAMGVPLLAMGGEKKPNWGVRNSDAVSKMSHSVQISVQFTPSAPLQVDVSTQPPLHMLPAAVAAR